MLRSIDLNLAYPLVAVPESVIIPWCEEQPAIRYRIMAAAIRPFGRAGDDDPPAWTDLAFRILKSAPDRIEVLNQYSHQLMPMHWSGSRAAILESNAKLLADLELYPDPAVQAFVAQEKIRLSKETAEEKLSESRRNKEQDHRFE